MGQLCHTNVTLIPAASTGQTVPAPYLPVQTITNTRQHDTQEKRNNHRPPAPLGEPAAAGQTLLSEHPPPRKPPSWWQEGRAQAAGTCVTGVTKSHRHSVVVSLHQLTRCSSHAAECNRLSRVLPSCYHKTQPAVREPAQLSDWCAKICPASPASAALGALDRPAFSWTLP